MLVLVADVICIHQMPLSQLPGAPKNNKIGGEVSAQEQVKVLVPAVVKADVTRAALPHLDLFGVCVSTTLLLCWGGSFMYVKCPYQSYLELQRTTRLKLK